MNQKNQLAFFSANLHQYLPEIPWQDHPKLFQWHQDYHRPRPISRGNIHDVFRALTPDASAQPGLLAAFHLGAHTALPVSLARSGIDFDILIDRQVHHRYQEALTQTDQELMRSGRTATGFYYSDDPRLFFQIRKSLRSGRHILIYVDGNGGANTKEKISSLLEVPFFSGTLWLRQGIAVLARMLQVPIYPLLNGTIRDQCLVQMLPAIWADAALSREMDTRRILRLLYGELENWLEREGLMHWECWRYLHYNGMLRPDSSAQNSSFCLPNPLPEYIVPLVHPAGHFWMDKSRYVIHYGDNVL